MSDEKSNKDKKEKKEKKEKEEKEKKEKKEAEDHKASSHKKFLGINIPGTRKHLDAKSSDPHGSYSTGDGTTPAASPDGKAEEGTRSRSTSTSGPDAGNPPKFGSLRTRSMASPSQPPPASLKPESFVSSPSVVAPAAPTPDGSEAKSSGKHHHHKRSDSTADTKPVPSPLPSPTAPKSKPPEVIISSEDIRPIPGPHEVPVDPDKQKPGETLVAKLKLQASQIGLLIAALLLSWVIGALGMSFVWTILLVIALYKTDMKIKKEGWVSYYRAQERKRLHELSKQSDFEKMEWLNILLHKAWPTYSNYMVAMTRAQAAKAIEQQFSKNKPPGVENVIIDRVEFGQIPPVIQSIKGYVARNEGSLQIEEQNTYQVDCNVKYQGDILITAKVYVKLGPTTFPLSITVGGIEFSGRMRCVAWLLPREPFVEKVQFAFVSTPKAKFKVTPLGGMDVMSISALEGMVQKSIDDVMRSMLVLPNKFTYVMPGISVPTMVTATSVSGAVNPLVVIGKGTTQKNFVRPTVKKTLGTLKVEVVEGRTLRAMDANGKSDPYVKVKIGEVKKKTRVIDKALDPKWNEAFDFTVTNEFPRELHLSCFDFDKGLNSNDMIGEITFDFSELPAEQTQEMWLSLGPQNGDIHVRLTWFPEPTA